MVSSKINSVENELTKERMIEFNNYLKGLNEEEYKEFLKKMANKKKDCLLIEASDTNYLLDNYLKIIKHTLSDYISQNYKEDPDIAYTILEDYIDKAIDTSKEIERLIRLKINGERQLCIKKES